MFTLPNVDQKLQGTQKEKIEVLDDFAMAHFLKEENIKQGKWKNVHKVQMKNTQITDRSLELLCSNPVCEQIEQLELQNNFSSITDNSLQILAYSPYLTNLKYLDLSDSFITDEGLSTFVQSKNSKQLETLILYGNVQVGSDSLRSIALSKECRNLQVLDLRSTYISDTGFKEFCESQNLQNLRILNLSMNIEAITDETIVCLSLSKRIKSIEHLLLANCMITDEGIEALCKSSNFSKLKELDISNDSKDFNLNKITDKSLEYLSDTTFISELQKLNLRGLKVTSYGINYLSRSYNFMNLQFLRLSQNVGITDKAIDSIVQGSVKNLKCLNKLYLNDTSVTKDGVKFLIKSIPKIDVIYDDRMYIDLTEEDENIQKVQQNKSFKYK
ncbi:LRR, typical subtype protein (macronuclear) [Tetrahymena thermophila SB210]|uniref:LRR, typical subtype protein n=1 Tax=Tetrahymena thermophila (strain SB210) TaxID=312017 RepID=I7LZM8_TETTS|nr:LRR, typical subtype protein [Tetrahymena thermophila SB210]EAR84300.2 LRR, typical subtype protein [Tetrahymena thermophila SB210]|eukprot:XP_001031963.2 LRR, typical subtype protein [Tetrahymena thermophila SB210]